MQHVRLNGNGNCMGLDAWPNSYWRIAIAGQQNASAAAIARCVFTSPVLHVTRTFNVGCISPRGMLSGAPLVRRMPRTQ